MLDGLFRPQFAIGHEGGVEGAVLGPVGLGGNLRNDLCEDRLRRGDVRVKMADDGFGGDGLLLDLPAVVIRDHRQGGEGDLRLAGQFGLRQVRHADDIEAELTVRIRLCPRGERWPVHADVSAAIVDTAALGDAGIVQQTAQLVRKRVAKGDVSDDATAEERVLVASAGAVEKLVRQHDVTRVVFLLQTTDSGHGDDPAHVQAAQCPEIRTMIQLRGQDAVPFAMPGQEIDAASGQCARHECIGRRAERRLDRDFLAVFEAFEVVQAGTADDADGRGEILTHSGRVGGTRSASTVIILLLEIVTWRRMNRNRESPV